MSIEKRGRAWGVRLQVGGKEIRRSCGRGSSKQDARELEARILSDAVAGRIGRAPHRTIADALARWLEGEATTHKDHKNDLQRVRMWRPYSDGRPLREAVQVASRASDAWLAAGLSPATINRRIALLRRVCRLAHAKWGWLDEDLSRKLVALAGERQRRVFLSREEVMALVQAAEKPLGDAILLSAYTGLRQGELLRLRAEDVADGCVIVRQGKSKAAERYVPVPRQAAAILKRLPIPLTVHELDRGFRKVRKATKLTHVRWHDLRHSYGSWLAQTGAAATVIRDVMGHSNLTVTSRYLHTAPAHVRAAVRKLK